MKVLVTGAHGMLGRATVEHFRSMGDEVIALSREDLDVANASLVRDTLRQADAEVVINCAACTDVDGCETVRENNYAVNAHGPENLAVTCCEIGACLVTISTDYVFDGTKDGFYTQRDDPNPISEYGRAKLAGEQFAMAASARTIVVRVGWLFGVGGKNFLSRVPEMLARGESINAIADAYGTPTYAPHMARRLRELVLLDVPEIYHMANAGEGTSYAGFAREIAADPSQIHDISAETLTRPAPRPKNSRLKCLVQEALKLEPLPDWKEALVEFKNETAV